MDLEWARWMTLAACLAVVAAVGIAAWRRRGTFGCATLLAALVVGSVLVVVGGRLLGSDIAFGMAAVVVWLAFGAATLDLRAGDQLRERCGRRFDEWHGR